MPLAELIMDCARFWENNSKSPAQIQAHSLKEFHRLLESVWDKTAFYPEYWGRFGIEKKDLKCIKPEDIPCITKDDIRNNVEKIMTEPMRRNESGEWDPGNRAIAVHSSGSTGTPLQFFYTQSALTKVEANFFRLSISGGKRYVGWGSLPIRVIHAASVGPGFASSLLLSGGISEYNAQCLVLKTSEPLEEWRVKIRNFNPNYLSGYPSCLSLLLDLQKQGRIHLHPLKIISGGEPLQDSLKHELEDCFGADIIDYYGCSESLLIGAGSSWYEGIYLFDDMNYCETDEEGHLIVTPLYNPVFPVIRYKLDDLVKGFTRAGKGPLPYTRIDNIIGREEDMLWFINETGKRDFLHPLLLDELHAEGLTGCQFIQTSDRSFFVNCVGPQAAPAMEKELRQQIDTILGEKSMRNVHYRIVFRDRLLRNIRSGKIPFTVPKDSLVEIR